MQLLRHHPLFCISILSTFLSRFFIPNYDNIWAKLINDTENRGRDLVLFSLLIGCWDVRAVTRERREGEYPICNPTPSQVPGFDWPIAKPHLKNMTDLCSCWKSGSRPLFEFPDFVKQQMWTEIGSMHRLLVGCWDVGVAITWACVHGV